MAKAPENPEMAIGGFEDSPFGTGEMIQLLFVGLETPLHVHKSVIPPAMAKKMSPRGTKAFSSQKSVCLSRLSPSASHTLVDYLYSGQYRELAWSGCSKEETTSRLKNAFQVYAAARDYELGHLEELARECIVNLSAEVPCFSILGIVEDMFQLLAMGEDPWFPTYIRSVVKRTFEDPAVLPDADLPTAGHSGEYFGKIILREATALYNEATVQWAAVLTATEHKPEVGTVVMREEDAREECEWGARLKKKKMKKMKKLQREKDMPQLELEQTADVIASGVTQGESDGDAGTLGGIPDLPTDSLAYPKDSEPRLQPRQEEPSFHNMEESPARIMPPHEGPEVEPQSVTIGASIGCCLLCGTEVKAANNGEPDHDASLPGNKTEESEEVEAGSALVDSITGVQFNVVEIKEEIEDIIMAEHASRTKKKLLSRGARNRLEDLRDKLIKMEKKMNDGKTPVVLGSEPEEVRLAEDNQTDRELAGSPVHVEHEFDKF